MAGRRRTSKPRKNEGSLTEALGKMTGDSDIEARGAAKKMEEEAEHRASKSKNANKS